jgi:radical SAM superfamily enzyme YgiQ (UPF0313 family)
MSPSIYLVNPRADSPTYFGGEVFSGRGFPPGVLMADLALPTLAAMIPDDFHVALCDENLRPVDFEIAGDFVAITGKITQRQRMRAIAAEFRRRHKVVLIGGPCASLSPESLRSSCDILVRGEAEDIAAELFAHLRAGTWKDEYVGGRPELTHSPIPRWELYPNDRALAGTVQTSRGCPFGCEFCDVIQYLGRHQRHKAIPQVLAELNCLYQYGYRFVFLADDNFTAWRSRTKELLVALASWNARRDAGRVRFITQLSIEAAEDAELLELCAAAGLAYVFIGLETPNEDSLKEAHKRQNLRANPVDQVRRFLDWGIAVTGGMIVGFDSDGPDIFDRQFNFAMETRVPVFSVGLLVAPEATPLHARMAEEGRLVSNGSEVAASPWSTNVIPLTMSTDQLTHGMQQLCRRLYDPAAFGERLRGTIDLLRIRAIPGAEDAVGTSPKRSIEFDALDLIRRLRRLGPAEADMLARVVADLTTNPEAAAVVSVPLLQYQQLRYMYEQRGVWPRQARGAGARAQILPEDVQPR